jgi:hypothetical protein
MTDAQILELAETYGIGVNKYKICICWKDELLKFARAIYEEGYDKGHDGGWEDRGITESSTYPTGLVGDPQ